MTSFPTILGNSGQYDGNALGSGGPGNYSANRFSAVGLGQSAMVLTSFSNPSNGFTNENSARQKFHVAGTVSDLTWGLDLAFGATLTFTLRQNAANTSLAVSFGPSDTGSKSDTTHSVSVASGDYLDFEADVGTGNSSYSGDFYCASARFTASSDSAQLISCTGPWTIGNLIASEYANFVGCMLIQANEPKSQFSARTSGTWEYMACHVGANSFDGATTIVNRLNGADGSMTIVVPSSAIGGTGLGNFEDTTHSDSVSNNDLLDYKFSTEADDGTLTFDWVGCHYLAGNAAHCMIGGMPALQTTIPDTAVTYTSLFGGGDIQAIAHNVPRATGTFPYDATLTRYANYIRGGEGTCTLMVNGSATALAITVTSGTTGWLVDTSHSVGVVQGDTCANRIAGSGVTDTKLTWDGAGLRVAAS